MLHSLCGVQCERAGFVMVLGPHEGESLIELFNRQSPVAAFAVVGCTHLMHWAAPAAIIPCWQGGSGFPLALACGDSVVSHARLLLATTVHRHMQPPWSPPAALVAVNVRVSSAVQSPRASVP